MSSKVTINVSDYELLDNLGKTNAIAVRDAFGRVTGYQVWDFQASNIRRRKLSIMTEINNKIDQFSLERENDFINFEKETGRQINDVLGNAKTQLESQMRIDLNKFSTLFNETKDRISSQIASSRTNMLNGFNQKVQVFINDLKKEMNVKQNEMQNEIVKFESDIAKQKTIANDYAHQYLLQSKQAIQTLEEVYDERYCNKQRVDLLKNNLLMCESNIAKGLYETAIAQAIDITTSSYEEVLLFDQSRQEYNALLKEANYHIDFLLKYSENRQKISKDVLQETNNLLHNRSLSQGLLKKDLKYFSPEHAIEQNNEFLNTFKNNLEHKTYTVQQLKDEIQSIKNMYAQVDYAYNEAVTYYGNYIERMAFLSNIKTKFENHGRIYKGRKIGENVQSGQDYTQPIFALFADESTGGEFIVEINAVKKADNSLESEFHIHKIQGDPFNQIENDQTERLVNEAISNNPDAFSRGGCQNNTINQLSRDQRIMEIRRQMNV